LVVVLVVVLLFQTPPMSKPLSLWLALSPYPTRDSNEKLPNSGTLVQFCNLEVGFLEIDQQQQQQ